MNSFRAFSCFIYKLTYCQAFSESGPMRVITLGVMLDRQVNLAKALSRKDEVVVAVPMLELSGDRSVGRGDILVVAFQMGVVYISSSSLSICSQYVEEVPEIRSRRRPHGAQKQHDRFCAPSLFAAVSLVATFHHVSLQTGERFFRFEIARNVVRSGWSVSLLSWIAFDTF